MAVVLLALVLLPALPALAQPPAPDPPGPYVIDLRGGTMALPGDPAFFPPLPGGTQIPTRGLALDAGAHVYLFQIGPARLGIGASIVRVQGSASPPEPATTSSGSTPPRTIPYVDANLTSLAPQISFNFGTADGWSYLSAGMGIARFEAQRAGVGAEVARTSGSLRAVNIGGGARWFRNRHLAITFDVRFHLLRGDDRPLPELPLPRTTLLSATAGISLR